MQHETVYRDIRQFLRTRLSADVLSALTDSDLDCLIELVKGNPQARFELTLQNYPWLRTKSAV